MKQSTTSFEKKPANPKAAIFNKRLKEVDARNVRAVLKPLYDHILVAPDEAETVTAGGIIIPDTNKEIPAKGTILAIGDGDMKPLITLPGERILYSKYAGVEIEYEGKKYKVLRETDVLCVINN